MNLIEIAPTLAKKIMDKLMKENRFTANQADHLIPQNATEIDLSALCSGNGMPFFLRNAEHCLAVASTRCYKVSIQETKRSTKFGNYFAQLINIIN